jgi:DNA-binding IclR family transcriptional regulator
VLLCIVRDPAVRLRDVAEQVGVTERAVQRIVAELEGAGYLRREKEGRCNRYEVDLAIPLRHPLEEHCPVSDLIKMVLGRSAAAGRGKPL